MPQRAEAYITNSTFGQFNASGRFKVVLSNCNIDGSSLGSTLLDLNNSELHMINSTFQRIKVNKGPVILKALASEIKIDKTVLMENRGNAGLIKVSNESILSVSTSTFKDNGQIFLESNSWIPKVLLLSVRAVLLLIMVHLVPAFSLRVTQKCILKIQNLKAIAH